MNYKVGDTVMCIDARPVYPPGELVCGQEYEVTSIYRGESGKTFVTVSAVDPKLGGFSPWRFIKLDGLTETQDRCDEVTA